MTENVPPHEPTISGEIVKTPSSALLRVLATVTGLLLVKAVFLIIVRYLLAFRSRGSAAIRGNLITVTEEWFLFGRSIRRRVTTAPIRDIAAVRFENRQRYLYLVVGFGCLVAGTLMGAQWFLDGLRAGYPYLTLVGASTVLAGVAADLALYLFYPFKGGRSHLTIVQGPWLMRFRGVETGAAEKLIEQLHRAWSSTRKGASASSPTMSVR